MRVLITGCTAQQANPRSHTRVANFAGLLRNALRCEGHEVFWVDPSVEWDTDTLKEHYDTVLVGLAPITSLGANRTFGALSVVERLWGDPKLRLFIDAPEPHRVTASLKAIHEHPHNLTKEFFAYRKQYELAKPEHGRLIASVNLLYNEEWPETIVPGLPWTDSGAIESSLPPGASEKVRPLNLDQFLLRDLPVPPEDDERRLQWSYEPGTEQNWLRQQNVQMPVVRLPKSSRREADPQAIQQLRESAGCLIGPDKDGTWWNTRYAQALSQRVPVFTDWRDTQALGRAWSMLPSTFEHSNTRVAREIADEQAEAYVNAIGSEDQARENLHYMLRLRRLTTL